MAPQWRSQFGPASPLSAHLRTGIAVREWHVIGSAHLTFGNNKSGATGPSHPRCRCSILDSCAASYRSLFHRVAPCTTESRVYATARHRTHRSEWKRPPACTPSTYHPPVLQSLHEYASVSTHPLMSSHTSCRLQVGDGGHRRVPRHTPAAERSPTHTSPSGDIHKHPHQPQHSCTSR
jgi:hypothetical protein